MILNARTFVMFYLSGTATKRQPGGDSGLSRHHPCGASHVRAAAAVRVQCAQGHRGDSQHVYAVGFVVWEWAGVTTVDAFWCQQVRFCFKTLKVSFMSLESHFICIIPTALALFVDNLFHKMGWLRIVNGVDYSADLPADSYFPPSCEYLETGSITKISIKAKFINKVGYYY